MNGRLAKFSTDQSLVARLDGIRLSARQLQEARVQMLRAEAIADFVYGAWILSSSFARRVAAAIARKSSELANAFAGSVIDAGARKRDAYLAKATDNADLERRLRMLQAPHRMPLMFARS